MLAYARIPTFVVLCFSLLTTVLHAQLDFESEPICYPTAPTNTPVDRLNQKLDAGEVDLSFDEDHGYLKSVLRQLDISTTSQTLVFSKTSFQLRRISARTPRALYFNDDVYIGWVQNGDVIEVSAVDENQGAVFYTLRQEQSERPRFTRDRGQCLVCHASSRTSGVPGHLVRSVYAGPSGQPHFGSGTFTTDHTSPFEERWGGWYVTGTHGRQRHMGNVTFAEVNYSNDLNSQAGANLTSLRSLLNTDPYLSQHSDIVALMVLEHQTRMHNLITRANFATRSAQHYDVIMNEAMGRPADHRSESATRRINTAAEKLVEYMLFANELELSEKVTGTSGFAAEFSARGRRDGQGRSLRDFDMKSRMMKYPCSYLIYSPPFDKLPVEVKDRVYLRLYEILSGQESSDPFSHLSADDRNAILEILRETKRGLPDYWRKGAS